MGSALAPPLFLHYIVVEFHRTKFMLTAINRTGMRIWLSRPFVCSLAGGRELPDSDRAKPHRYE